MAQHGLERVAVVEEGRLLGVLPREPVVRRLAEDEPPPLIED
jgi:CBS domain-containing protein